MRAKSILRLAAAVVAAAAVLSGPTPAPAAGKSGSFPDEIALPQGFRPEGIVVGRGSTFYAGSLANGALYRGDLRTGSGDLINPGDGAPTVGLAIDQRNLVYAAGGPSGRVKVFDGSTGAQVKTYTPATAPTFINDVDVTRTDAWFTDSQKPVLYRLPLGGATAPVTVPLTGDYVHLPGFNLNGIEASRDGNWLVAVQSASGTLFRIDPATGATTRIDTGGVSFANGDGLLLEGRTLYVVRNQANLVVVVRLAHDLASGTVVGTLTNPRFDVPTTVDRFGSGLYLVNARFTTPPTPTTPYRITRVDARPR